jgi:cyclopropane fatty-acyl-phospholipid synthase-like methyltransferase
MNFIYIFLSIIFIILSVCVVCFLIYAHVYGVDYEFETMLDKNGISNIYKDYCGYINFSDKYSTKYSTEYGEIQYKGMQNIYKIAKKNDISTFYDIGCGVGKSLIMAAILGYKKAIGIELVDARYNKACVVLNRCSPKIRNKIEIYNGDMMEFDRVFEERKPIIIFASNLTWPKEITKQFFKKYSNNLPKGSIIVSSLFNCYKEDEDKFTRRKIKIPMSWDYNSICSMVFIKS